MKKMTAVLAIAVMILVAGNVNAALTTIGTAIYDPDGIGGNPAIGEFNLIYEDDSIDGGLVWLDYSNPVDTQPNQDTWASGLGSYLTVKLDSGYTTDIDWAAGWRLPLTQDETQGNHCTGSEMGHLYFDSLGLPVGGTYGERPPFLNIQSYVYWSGTEYPGGVGAWGFGFNDSIQLIGWMKELGGNALAVRPGQVSAVPIPTAIWLLGSGVAGLGIFLNRKRRHLVI